MRVAVCGLILSLTDRILLFGLGVPIARMYFATDTSALVLMVGCIVAIRCADGRLSRPSRPLLVLSLVALAAIVNQGGWSSGIIFMVLSPIGVAASTAVLIMYAISTDRARGLGSRPLRLAGALSYSLYLWQTPLSIVTLYHPDLLSYQSAIAFTVVAAGASYVLIERPFIGIRRRSGSVAAV